MYRRRIFLMHKLLFYSVLNIILMIEYNRLKRLNNVVNG